MQQKNATVLHFWGLLYWGLMLNPSSSNLQEPKWGKDVPLLIDSSDPSVNCQAVHAHILPTIRFFMQQILSTVTETLIQVAGTVQQVDIVAWAICDVSSSLAEYIDWLLWELAADDSEHVFVCTHTCLLWGAEG